MCSYDFRDGKYLINNIKLENVTFYKDLVIIFENNNNLLINTHIDYIFKKAYLSLNLICRCITIKSQFIFTADKF